ncbi:class I SAM-dependent methyltransferase [Williamsia sp. CHRR-6]|uniref:class I SAM-dependent methyltransferase n=1 Tax=Williamsia sp. CHRR-6 TaxID=2835871 RepID=UPI001BDA1F3D|nr:class I SAM-dependent methyltransferase [Williamsia sp. CHRR-6]MBT0568176.1 methyltransferase domain-containing protein [Williamsia sp. CHRR-6]
MDVWSDKDLTGNSSAALRLNARRHGVAERIVVTTADAVALPLPDDSVDVVGSVFCLHNIAVDGGLAVACREIARVLRPGGIAVIADFPGVSRHVDELRAAGLQVDGPHRGDSIARGPAGYLLARAPA